jgi:hypothetical protein
MRRKALTAVVAAALLATAAGCGGGKGGSGSTAADNPQAHKTVDTGSVARAIERSIAQQRRLDSTVVCPPTEPATLGSQFRCVATTLQKHKLVQTPFVVTVRNQYGGVKYLGVPR